MKLLLKVVVLLFCINIGFSQENFVFSTSKTKTKLSFKLVNNLIIIPIEVNGVSLNFLLDTGVSETILFSIDESQTLTFQNTEKIKISGFGQKEPIDAFKSSGNTLRIKNLIDKNHAIYLVLDQDINISSQIGLPVNGIIGQHFFQNHLVEIDYISKKIILSIPNDKRNLKKLNKFSKFDISIEKGRPYMYSFVNQKKEQDSIKCKMLVDTGNSEAVWLFTFANPKIKVPEPFVSDYLGRGICGDVFGKRGRIEKFKLSEFSFNQPLVSFPNAESSENFDNTTERVGSIGSELLRRFKIIFDYPNNAIYLKKNSNYKNPFTYNMSGIEIEHSGLQWFKEEYEVKKDRENSTYVFENEPKIGYKFRLKPIFIVSNIRLDSPGAKAGLQKDDIFLKINGNQASNYNLQELNDILKSGEGKEINLEIERKSKIIKFTFLLQNIL